MFKEREDLSMNATNFFALPKWKMRIHLWKKMIKESKHQAI